MSTQPTALSCTFSHASTCSSLCYQTVFSSYRDINSCVPDWRVRLGDQTSYGITKGSSRCGGVWLELNFLRANNN